jgi:hypothetical protein
MWDPLGSDGTFLKATAAQPNRLPSISQQLCQSYFLEVSSQQLFSKSQPNQTHPEYYCIYDCMTSFVRILVLFVDFVFSKYANDLFTGFHCFSIK